MARIAGSLSFAIDGTTYTTEGTFTLEPSSTENEARVAHNGTVHHAERQVAPRFECTIQHTPGVRLLGSSLGALNGGTVTVQLANGLKYDFIGSVVEGRVSADVSEGTVSFSAFAESCVERT